MTLSSLYMPIIPARCRLPFPSSVYPGVVTVRIVPDDDVPGEPVHAPISMAKAFRDELHSHAATRTA
jgi:hypothetical protein